MLFTSTGLPQAATAPATPERTVMRRSREFLALEPARGGDEQVAALGIHHHERNDLGVHRRRPPSRRVWSNSSRRSGRSAIWRAMRRAPGEAIWRSGSVKQKRLPPVGRDSTQMRPPCSPTMPRAIASPSPVPSTCCSPAWRAAEEALEHARQILGRDAGPLILDRAQPVLAAHLRRDASPAPPTGENLTALPTQVEEQAAAAGRRSASTTSRDRRSTPNADLARGVAMA